MSKYRLSLLQRRVLAVASLGELKANAAYQCWIGSKNVTVAVGMLRRRGLLSTHPLRLPSSREYLFVLTQEGVRRL